MPSPTTNLPAVAWMRPVIAILSAMCVVVAGTIVVLLLDGTAGAGVQAANIEPMEVVTPAERDVLAAEALRDEPLLSMAIDADEIEIEIEEADEADRVEADRVAPAARTRARPRPTARRPVATHRPAPADLESDALVDEAALDVPSPRAQASAPVLERFADTARVRFDVASEEQPVLHWRKPGAGWKQAEMRSSGGGWSLHVRFTQLEGGALLWWVGDADGHPMTLRGPGRPHGLALD